MAKKKKTQKVGYTKLEQERRFNKWVEGLNMEQRLFLYRYAKESASADLQVCCMTYDRVLRCQLLKNFSLDDTEITIQNIINDVTSEAHHINEMNKKGYDYMKKVDKYKDDICQAYEEMVKSGKLKSDKEGMKELISRFPTLTPTSIKSTIAKHLKTKATEEVVEEKEIEEAYDYIFSDEKAPKTRLKYVDHKEEVVKVQDLKKEKEVKEKSTIEIVLKKLVMQLKGTFGTYDVEDNIVSNSGNVFKNVEDVEAAYQEQLKHIEENRTELLNIYKLINNQINS